MRRFAAALALLSVLATTPAARADMPDWWRTDYIADYASIVAAMGISGGLNLLESNTAAFGPVFRPDQWQRILGDEHSDTIGRKHGSNTVPGYGLAIWAGVGLLSTAVMEWTPGINGLDHTDWQLAHDTTIGYLEALSWTIALTEITKVGFGRLRPDFQDRVRRVYCGKERSIDPACASYDGPSGERGLLKNGRRSFISGHASMSFATATYWSLVIGGRAVWGDRADSTSMALGVLVQTGLMAIATWVASSRITDGRHHIEDIVAGALVGFMSANAAYWRHFDTDGMPRKRVQAPRSAAPQAPRTVQMGFGGTF